MKTRLTPEEQQRIRENVGRISISEIARLLGRERTTVYKWAAKNTTSFERKIVQPRPVQAIESSACVRHMLRLASVCSKQAPERAA